MILASPFAICCRPRATARKPDPQSWFRPQAVFSLGTPAVMAAMRAGFWALARRQNLAEDHLVDIIRLDLGPRQGDP